MTTIIYIASLIAAGVLIAALAFQFGTRSTMAAIDAGAMLFLTDAEYDEFERLMELVLAGKDDNPQ